MLSLTPSHVIQHLYCPRFTYFEWVLRIPQYEEKFGKVLRGRHLHDERLARNKDYLRKRLGVVSRVDDQYLTNDYLRGRIDEVLTLADGTMAPLDYKFAEYKDVVYSTYRTQLYCYALLVEANFGKSVQRGFIVYTRSNNKVIEVPVTRDALTSVQATVADIGRVVGENFFPKATPVKERCVNCTYRNVCVR
ncbi:CRISPR-associated protein Cas4 [Neolewinella lacunae]|uniref:CRISPR-associated exonuclease Cas4 n=1 Tax=Neolewinella lacunae TaxID=1517758 RepID=A0A923PLH3_9BACT|nr:CRISPR-associated protein Cas4 [Neolewinella lacunae]MBC6994625.1 CRISPR-associated protein Cas4 [Neolewinella lacunae]MDN3634497.1 CRISPR-associated protein Cas4 [Neolewinella lacunae]